MFQKGCEAESTRRTKAGVRLLRLEAGVLEGDEGGRKRLRCAYR